MKVDASVSADTIIDEMASACEYKNENTEECTSVMVSKSATVEAGGCRGFSSSASGSLKRVQVRQHM